MAQLSLLVLFIVAPTLQARYITVNNFTLVDVTGLPTHWGHWDPATINGLRDWSDGRGINSLEILGLLVGALRYSPAGSADQALFTQAIQYLAYDNDYAGNLVNLRINAPVDINYSDDEVRSTGALAGLPTHAPLIIVGTEGLLRGSCALAMIPEPILATGAQVSARAYLARSFRLSPASVSIPGRHHDRHDVRFELAVVCSWSSSPTFPSSSPSTPATQSWRRCTGPQSSPSAARGPQARGARARTCGGRSTSQPRAGQPP